MRITHKHLFRAPMERVIAMLQDEECARARASAAGAADAEVYIDTHTDGAFTVVIRRSVPSSSVPAEFRSLVGSDLAVRYTEAWLAPASVADAGAGAAREGTFALEIVGAPGHARGSLVLKATPEGVAFGLAGDVQAPVPLLGPVVEKVVVGAIEGTLPKELAAADAWLARQG